MTKLKEKFCDKDCKYFAVCGDTTRERPCEGYARSTPKKSAPYRINTAGRIVKNSDMKQTHAKGSCRTKRR